MKRLPIATLVLSLGVLTSCATSHAIRYAYGSESAFAEAADPETGDVSRAVFSPGLIIFSVVWDIVTLPSQLIFGVWPYWGDESLSMRPDQIEAD